MPVADFRLGVDDLAGRLAGVAGRDTDTLPVEDLAAAAAAPASTLPVDERESAVCTLPVPPLGAGVAAREGAADPAAAAGFLLGCTTKKQHMKARQ